MCEISMTPLNNFLAEPPTYGANAPAVPAVEGWPRYIRITDISESGELFNSDIKGIDSRIASPYLLAEGDILIARSGNTVGKSYIQRNSAFLAAHAGYLIKLRFDRKKANPIFIFHYLHSGQYWSWVKSASKVAAQPNINATQYSQLPIPNINVSEQGVIAAILDTMDEAIRQTEAVIAKLRQVKAGMLHDLLTRGLDENGELRDPICHSEQFKDSPLGKVPATWEIGPLIAFATLQRGFDIIVADQIAGNIPVVSSSGITSYHNEAAVNGPGVVIGRKGKLGEAYFLEGPFWPHDTSLWVKNFHGNDERFTALFLKFLRLERFDAATSVPTLNRNVIHPLLVSIPPKSEQIDIVTHLEEHEAVIQREASVLNKLNTIKKGLMHDLLTGTIRVPPNLLEAIP